jgi:hypothetical protein
VERTDGGLHHGDGDSTADAVLRVLLENISGLDVPACLEHSPVSQLTDEIVDSSRCGAVPRKRRSKSWSNCCFLYPTPGTHSWLSLC